MLIQYSANPLLPRLAWSAAIDMPSGTLHVLHGQDIEARPLFFVEGAWAGEFDAGQLDSTEVIFGSGAMLVDGGVLFISSLATTDYLFYKQTPSAFRVANSLALLLAAIGDELDPAFLRYHDVNNSVMQGVEEYERAIPTRHGCVSRLMHHNLRVDANGPTEVPKPDPPPFPSFDSYAAYLSASYSSLASNARDANRRRPLKIYSTQSRGYDTTAVNAIATKHGLDGVFTITTGKGGGAFSDQAAEAEVSDDGSEVARALGVAPVVALERRAFQQDFADEVYYHASVHEPQDANLKQVIDHITAPALLLTGTLGDMWYTNEFWYRNKPEHLKPDLRRVDLSLHGLTEPRLRAGYIQVAIPYIGARRRVDIFAITESAEMSPWRLGTNYDRPIPRRIGETAGVPRAMFGQVKIGSVVEFTRPQVPQSAALRQSYFEFLQRSGLRSARQLFLFPLVHKLNQTIWFASEARDPAVYYGQRLVLKLLGRDMRLRPFWSDLRGSLHCFAVNMCVREYQAALSGA